MLLPGPARLDIIPRLEGDTRRGCGARSAGAEPRLRPPGRAVGVLRDRRGQNGPKLAAKRARTAETPKQPSLSLRLRAPYFYPNP